MVTRIWQILDGLEAALGGEWVTPWCVCKSVCVGQGGFGRSPLNGVSKHTPTTIQALANTHTHRRHTLHITQKHTYRHTHTDKQFQTHTYTQNINTNTHTHALANTITHRTKQSDSHMCKNKHKDLDPQR